MNVHSTVKVSRQFNIKSRHSNRRASVQKEPYILWKEPYLHTEKKTHTHNCSGVARIQNHILPRQSWSNNVKRALHIVKRALHIVKGALHIVKRALHMVKRALHIVKREVYIEPSMP